MNIKLLWLNYNKKIELIEKYNQYYYEKNKSIVADSEYDELKKQILLLEKKYNFLNHKNSPSKIIGYKPSKNFKKVTHKVPMLSLGNAFSENDLNNFEKKILNYINDFKFEDIEYSAEPKIDGISASLIYKDGIFIKGLSRGDGKEGEDITKNSRQLINSKETVKIINSNFTRNNYKKGCYDLKNYFFKRTDVKDVVFKSKKNHQGNSAKQAKYYFEI